ncbi:unnamed protein product [Allacma fusca]|uniref:Uncharacterized protein n=1 Tax=Allacma fusca TaxID=39272 RepID=A0A8J2LJ25_9HEXA|nr:unnamed protein product [Allacma fusca]
MTEWNLEIDIIRKIQIEGKNVAMGYRPNIKTNVQQQMERAGIHVENNSAVSESQGSEPSTSRPRSVITLNIERLKPSYTDKLASSDSKDFSEKGVAYPKRVPQPTIVASSEEDTEPEVYSQDITNKVYEEKEKIRTGLDQDLDNHWKEIY